MPVGRARTWLHRSDGRTLGGGGLRVAGSRSGSVATRTRSQVFHSGVGAQAAEAGEHADRAARPGGGEVAVEAVHQRDGVVRRLLTAVHQPRTQV